MFVDDFITPLFLDSRIERLHETDLPKASIKNGCVYCRMKADDFWLPLPPGYRAMPPIITSGGFDWVEGNVEVHLNSSNRVWAGESWLPNRLQAGPSVTVNQISEGLLIKFHYFGDK